MSYPCPVHCRFFGTDRDMILAVVVKNKNKNKKEHIYICPSAFFEEVPCDFSFPAGLPRKEIDKLAKKKIQKLEKKLTRPP